MLLSSRFVYGRRSLSATLVLSPEVARTGKTHAKVLHWRGGGGGEEEEDATADVVSSLCASG